MSSAVPDNPKIYHIVHIDKLSSIIKDGYLWSDAIVQQRRLSVGTTIGMEKIKKRRMQKQLASYPGLHVGDCVPFYFCPRSVMLYMFYKKNHTEITYKGGQEPIVHMMADLKRVVEWADENGKRWIFTNSNAGSFYFDDYNNLDDLDKINWNAVNATSWVNFREEKQSEFLIEKQFPWHFVEGVWVYSQQYFIEVNTLLAQAQHKPNVRIKRDWYY